VKKITIGPAWIISWQKKLNKQKKQSREERPSRYFMGQEFLNDHNSVPIRIICQFPAQAELNDYEYKTKKFQAYLWTSFSNLILVIERSISKSLRDSIFSSDNDFLFFLGYINQALFGLNDYLIKQRYLSGHLLVQTFSIFDINKIEIIDTIKNVSTEIEWPRALPNFPPTLELSSECDKRYIRDYIDSMNYYLFWNNDECIRKLITSLENYFSEYKITGKKIPYSKGQIIVIKFIYLIAILFGIYIKSEKGSFLDKLIESLNKNYYLPNWSNYFYIWISNIKFIYKLRNKIIHKNLRLIPEHRWICKKGIGTLSYIYQSSLIESETRNYIRSLVDQFLLISHSIEDLDLDRLSVISNFNESDELINPSFDELDEYQFHGLEIEKKEQNQIIKFYKQK